MYVNKRYSLRTLLEKSLYKQAFLFANCRGQLSGGFMTDNRPHAAQTKSFHLMLIAYVRRKIAAKKNKWSMYDLWRS